MGSVKYEEKHTQSFLVKIKSFDDFRILDIQNEGEKLIQFSTESSSLNQIRKDIESKIDLFNKEDVNNFYVLIVFEKDIYEDGFISIVAKRNNEYLLKKNQFFNIEYYINGKNPSPKSQKTTILFSALISSIIFISLAIMSLFVEGGDPFVNIWWHIGLLSIVGGIIPSIKFYNFIGLDRSLKINKHNIDAQRKKNDRKIINIIKSTLISIIIVMGIGIVSIGHHVKYFIEQDIQNNTVLSEWTYKHNKKKQLMVVSKGFERSHDINNLTCKLRPKITGSGMHKYSCFVIIDYSYKENGF